MVARHITNLPSEKHSGRRTRTQMLVVHSAETPLAAGYAASVTSNWLNLPDVGASINTFFGPDTTVRAVNTDCAAWHATWANARSVGYEFTGYAALTRAQWLTDAGKDMLDRAGREMAEDAELFNIPLRYLTTAEVNDIANGNTTIKGIATHKQIDPVNRTDPGDGFPYDVLLASIRKYAGGSPATPTKPTTKPIQEDDMPLTTADINKLLDHPIARRGGQSGSTTLRNTAAFLDANLLNIPAGVWAETVLRGGRNVSVKQELADAKTLAERNAAENVALRTVLAQIAAGGTIDLKAIEAAVKSAVSKAITDGVALDATVTIKADQ